LWFADVVVSVVEYPASAVENAEEEAAFIRELSGLVERSQQPRMLLDLSQMPRLSSRMLSALLALEKQCRQRNGIVVLCLSDPAIRQVFRVTKLDGVFLIVESREDSLRYLKTSEKKFSDTLIALYRRFQKGDEHNEILDSLPNFAAAAPTKRLPGFQDRDDLWQLLVAIYRQKVNSSRGEPVIPLLSETIEAALTPLEPELRQYALARLEGKTNQELAELFGVSLRTVERRLHLIRRILQVS